MNVLITLTDSRGWDFHSLLACYVSKVVFTWGALLRRDVLDVASRERKLACPFCLCKPPAKPGSDVQLMQTIHRCRHAAAFSDNMSMKVWCWGCWIPPCEWTPLKELSRYLIHHVNVTWNWYSVLWLQCFVCAPVVSLRLMDSKTLSCCLPSCTGRMAREILIDGVVGCLAYFWLLLGCRLYCILSCGVCGVLRSLFYSFSRYCRAVSIVLAHAGWNASLGSSQLFSLAYTCVQHLQ